MLIKNTIVFIKDGDKITEVIQMTDIRLSYDPWHDRALQLYFNESSFAPFRRSHWNSWLKIKFKCKIDFENLDFVFSSNEDVMYFKLMVS